MSYLYTLYRTTNTINGKFYIGIHKTTDPNDTYLGSGKVLKKSIEKYGRKNFVKEIIYVSESLDEIRYLEENIVNSEFIQRKDTYNIAVGGGLGGKDLNGFTFKGRNHTQDSIDRIQETRKLTPYVLSEHGKQSISRNNKENVQRKQKISETLSGVPKSDEYKKNHSKVMKEYYRHNPNRVAKGIPKPVICCPHCDKSGSPNNMYRWHFDNCKYKGN